MKYARDVNAHDIRYDPDDSRPVYIGVNEQNNQTTTALDWIVYLFIYTTTTASDITRIRRSRGSWDGRAALFP